MPDRRFIGDFESLLRFVRRSLLEAVIAKSPVLGGIGVTFGNDPIFLEPVPLITGGGLITTPVSDDAPNGWGQPFPPFPLGTPGGVNPEVIFDKDDMDVISIRRSDEWFIEFGSVTMANIAGGSDWQSLDGSVVISYGDLDKNRYHPTPGAGVFKDGIQLTSILSAYTAGLIAICADVSEPAYLVATTAASGGLGTTITVTAVFMTDANLNVVDVGKSPQTVLTYDTNLLNDAVDSSVVISANFSPSADKFVATTENGGMVEFSITSLVGTPVLEKDIVDSTDREYQPGDITTDPNFSLAVNEFLTCSFEEAPNPSNWRYTFDRRVVAGVAVRTTMNKADITYVLASDFDQITNDRVDLELVVSGTRINQEVLNKTEGIQSGQVVDVTKATPGSDAFCSGSPLDLFNAGTIVDNGTQTFSTSTIQQCDDTGITTSLKIGGNTIASLQPVKATEHTTNIVPAGPATRFADATIYDFDKIFDADLRTGFVAFTYVELDRTSVIYTGSGTVNMTENREYVIEGGAYLLDDTNTDTIVSTPLIGTGGGPYDILDFEDRCIDFDETDAIYKTVFTSGIPSLSRFNAKDSSGGNAFKNPDHHMAYTNMEHERGGSYEYNEYSDGDPVVISEITGTNPKVKPNGVI